MKNLNNILILSLAIAPVALLGGCDKEEPIASYQAPKAPAKAAASAAPQQPGQAAELQWKLPEGWKSTAPAPMSSATFTVDDQTPPLTLTVTPLPNTPSARSLTENINRWEGQLGLPPTPRDAIHDITKHVDVGPLHIDTVDLVGAPSTDPAKPQQRMLAAILPHDQQVWFLKLMGPADRVAAQKAKFDAFVQSLHLGQAASGAAAAAHDHDHDHDHAHAKPAGGTGKLTWSVPAGWTQDATPRAMREATLFTPGAADQRGELAISKLSRNVMGDLAGNVNRWRQMVGLPADPNAGASKPEAITIAGRPGALFDFAGPEGKDQKRMLIAMVPEGDQIWFFRIIGPASVVSEQKASFDAFLKSLKFE